MSIDTDQISIFNNFEVTNFLAKEDIRKQPFFFDIKCFKHGRCLPQCELRPLGFTNPIIDDSDFKPSEFEGRNLSDSKYNVKILLYRINLSSIIFDLIQPIID